MKGDRVKKSTNSLVGSVSINNSQSRESFEVLWKDRLLARVVIEFSTQKVKVEQYSPNPVFRPFGSKPDESVTISEVLNFLEERCFPRERVNMGELLDGLNLVSYKPLDIVRKTHGLMQDDYMWIRFSGESIAYDSIKVRD